MWVKVDLIKHQVNHVVLNSDKLNFNTIVQFLNYKEFSKQK